MTIEKGVHADPAKAQAPTWLTQDGIDLAPKVLGLPAKTEKIEEKAVNRPVRAEKKSNQTT